MRLFLALLVFVFCLRSSPAQNLIQNGDLEDTIPKSFGLKFPKYWDSPTDASPDYFSEYHNGIALNQFFVPMNFVGFQSPKSWKSYLGFSVISFNSPTIREYIQNELQERLKNDSVYCFQMYISLADSFSLATKNSIGVYFSDFKIDSNFFTRLNLNPQIILDSSFIINKNGWLRLNGEYKAEGSEEYVIIGNFNSDANTDTLELNNGGDQLWMDGAYYYIDDVYLGSCDSLPEDTSIGLRENILNDKLNIYPNPFENRVVVSYEGNEELEVRLFDVMGKEVSFAYISTSLNVTNEMVLSVAHLPKGLYFLEIVAGEGRISRKIIKQ
jgi:hypothetical protein